MTEFWAETTIFPSELGGLWSGDWSLVVRDLVPRTEVPIGEASLPVEASYPEEQMCSLQASYFCWKRQR